MRAIFTFQVVAPSDLPGEQNTMFIKCKYNEEFMKVNVKKQGRPNLQTPLGKKCSGPLLMNAAKLKDIQNLLPYIQAKNHHFYKNMTADNEAKSTCS
jgi:hypothetical protein